MARAKAAEYDGNIANIYALGKAGRPAWQTWRHLQFRIIEFLRLAASVRSQLPSLPAQGTDLPDNAKS